MFPGVSGTWLDPVYITGQRTLATGAVQPSYFFEELVLGNGIGKLASGIVGMIKGVGFAANRVLKPLGLGSMGRTMAANLTEQLSMKEAMSNPAAGEIIKRMKPLSDPRWSGWRKM